MQKEYFVYIMTNINNSVLYIEVTNDLKRRIYEHKSKLIKGFSEKYNLCKLVYYERTNDIETAIAREKQLKMWRRDWKMSLIKSQNPSFDDLNIN